MPRPGDVDHVEVALADAAAQMRIDEVEARGGAPVTEQPRLDVMPLERLLQQRVVVEVDLADREVVGCAPERIDVRKLGGIGGRFRHGGAARSWDGDPGAAILTPRT